MFNFKKKTLDPVLRRGFDLLEGRAPLTPGNPVDGLLEARDETCARIEHLAVRPQTTYGYLSSAIAVAAASWPLLQHKSDTTTLAASALVGAAAFAVGIKSMFNARCAQRDMRTFGQIADGYVLNAVRREPQEAIHSIRYQKRWLVKPLDPPSSKDERPARLRHRVLG